MDVGVRAYLDNILDKNLYMACAGNMRGFNSQSGSEAFHNSNSKARALHVYGDESVCLSLVMISNSHYVLYTHTHCP